MNIFSPFYLGGLRTTDSQVQRRGYTPLSCVCFYRRGLVLLKSVYIASPMGLCAAKLEIERMALWFSFIREPKPLSYDPVHIILKDNNLKSNNSCHLSLPEDLKEFYEKL